MIEFLPPVAIEGHVSSGLGNDSHPMRIMTRRVAGLDEGGWDREAEHLVTGLFDELAAEWHTRTSPERRRVVSDAITRGLTPLLSSTQLAIEVGSGIGTYSPLLAEVFTNVLSVDISLQMLIRAAPEISHRVLSDAGSLPVRSGAADAVVMINAFLFPGEVERVLRMGGVILWVNSSGEETPIHLSTEDVVRALPFAVEGVESRAGVATWCALRRI